VAIVGAARETFENLPHFVSEDFVTGFLIAFGGYVLKWSTS